MQLYLARKDGIQFYIQPDMIEAYANMGYTIIKLQEQIVDDVPAEIMEISEMEGRQNE